MKKFDLLSDKYTLQFKVEVQIPNGGYIYDELCDMQRMLDILCGCDYAEEAGKLVPEALLHEIRSDCLYGDQSVTEWNISTDDNPHTVFVGIHRFEKIA